MYCRYKKNRKKRDKEMSGIIGDGPMPTFSTCPRFGAGAEVSAHQVDKEATWYKRATETTRVRPPPARSRISLTTLVSEPLHKIAYS